MLTIKVYDLDGTDRGFLENGSDSGSFFAVEASFRRDRLPLGLGAWSVTVRKTHPLAGVLLNQSCAVRFFLDGVPKFAGLLGEPSQETVSRREEEGELLTVSGENLIALWGWSCLDPELGVGKHSPDDRWFGPQSRYYDTGDHPGWVSAVPIKGVFAATPAQWREELGPLGWSVVASNAYWIWARPQGAGSPPQPVACAWGVKDVTLPSQGDYASIATADDGLEGFWVDGELILSRVQAFMWGQTLRADDVFRDAGTARLCLKGRNIERDVVATNVAGMVAAFGRSEDGGIRIADPVLAVTDSSWLAWDEAEHGVPGMNAHEIAAIMLAEAQAHDELTGWTLPSTVAVDAAGNAWTSTALLTFPVGTPDLDVLRVVAEQIADVVVDEFNQQLLLYNKGTLGADRTATVVLAEGVSIADDGVRHGRLRKPEMNVALLRSSDGLYTEVTRPASVGRWGRIRRFLSLGTAEGAEQAAESVEPIFDEVGGAYWEVSIDVRPGPLPLVDFGEFDTVTAPGPDGTATDTTVDSVMFTWDRETGVELWRIEGRQEVP